MRIIKTETIIDAVEMLCSEANYFLDDNIKVALINASKNEKSPIGQDILLKLIENAKIASEKRVAMCQDTGMAVLFVELGQDVRIEGGLLTDALNEGIRRGYQKGYLRNSVVKDPFNRVNTGDNTPAVVHYDIVAGDRLSITIAPKGFGSENMSALKMLKPSDGLAGAKSFILNAVSEGGANACPPLILGIGIGGTMEKAAILAKKALLRPVGEHNKMPEVSAFETEILVAVNELGIGPAGLGGTVTALWASVETFPTHIAGLPVAVNIGCHATRHAGVLL